MTIYDYYLPVSVIHIAPTAVEKSQGSQKNRLLLRFLKLQETHKENGRNDVRVLILAPIVKDRRGEYTDLFASLKKRGYTKVRIDGDIFNLTDDFILIKTNKHTIELIIDSMVLSKETERTRLSTDVEQALQFGDGEMIVSVIKDASFTLPDKPEKMEDQLFSEKFACPVCNISLPEIEPRIFSFNTPHGACPTCSGLGRVLNADPELIINNNLTINEGGIVPFFNIGSSDTWFSRTFKTFCDENNIPLNKLLGEIDETQKHLLLFGTGGKKYLVEGENRFGRETVIEESFRGIAWELKRRYNESDSQFVKTQIDKFMRFDVCPDCKGGRLKKEALSITLDNVSIIDVSSMSIEKSLAFIISLPNVISPREQEISKMILREIRERLQFLVDVGLEYLTLQRGASTLSGGEAQRIRLASQIGSGSNRSFICT